MKKMLHHSSNVKELLAYDSGSVLFLVFSPTEGHDFNQAQSYTLLL